MKLRFFQLCIFTALLILFTHCNDSVTQSGNIDQQLEIDKAGLIAPGKDSEQPASLNFRWKKMKEANSFQFQLSGEQSFSSTIIDDIADSTGFAVEGLPSDTTLYWRVKPIVEDAKTLWSSVWHFRVVNESVDSSSVSIKLKSPKSGTTGHKRNVELKWNKIEDVEEYIVQMAGNENFNTLLIDSTVATYSYEAGDLDFDKRYFWRVKPVLPELEVAWSQVYEFSTKSAPEESEQAPAPELVTPKNKAGNVDREPAFKWNKIEDADSYIIHVSHGNDMILEKEIGKTNITPSEALPAGETYHWRVRAVVDNTKGNWSDINEFTTSKEAPKPLPVPKQLNPEEGASDVSQKPTFKWESVERANAYNLEVLEGEQVIVETRVEGTNFTSSEALAAGATYQWRIRAVQNEANGEWSEKRSFTTIANKPLSAPAIVSPDDKATKVAQKPEFKWKAVDGAEAYLIHVDNGDGLVVDRQVEGTSFKPSERFNAEHTYYWRIRAVTGDTENKWTEVRRFTTVAEKKNVPPVSLVSPMDGSRNHPTFVLLEWSGLDGVTGYKLQLATSSSFNSPDVDEMTNNTSFETSSLAKDQSYYWRVQAVADGNNSNWSAVRSFHTEAAPVEDGSSVSSDRQALMDLYAATGGDQWTNSSGWGSSAPLDLWHGIETDARGRVTRIDLWHNNLNGTLPPSVGNLDKVRYLNVKFNDLTGTIPPSIGNMSSLQTLILQGRTYEIAGTQKEPPDNFIYTYHQGKYYSNTNEFSGQIPPELGNLSNLEILELSRAKKITGPIPPQLGRLSNLKGLYLTGNDFAGHRLPPELGNLTELRHLYITGAGLVGEIPASFRNLTKLTALFLYGSSDTESIPNNALSGELPDFSDFTELRYFMLGENEFTGELPHYFNNGNFTHLVIYNVAGNNLTGPLHGFENLPHIKAFDAQRNNLTGPIDPVLTTVPHNIRIIGLGWNNLSGDFPQSGWADFTRLKTFNINNNNLTGDIPCSFWEKLGNPRLRRYWHDSNNFDDTCPGGIAAMEKFEG